MASSDYPSTSDPSTQVPTICPVCGHPIIDSSNWEREIHLTYAGNKLLKQLQAIYSAHDLLIILHAALCSHHLHMEHGYVK